MPINEPTFWETKYQNAEHRWDLGEAAPPLVSFFETTQAPKQGHWIVLGCGHGHDAVFLAQQGFEVTAVDFAPSAIAIATALATSKGVDLNLIQKNIFDLEKSHKSHKTQFDYLFEHTCFCAIAPEQRPDYVRLAATILKPQGLLYGIFYTHGRAGGPPFDSTPAEIRELFAPYFEILTLEAIANSTPNRQGDEHWAIFQKK